MSNNKYPPLGLDSTMPFGKYKGRTIRELMKVDQQYLNWLTENTTVRISYEQVKQENDFDKTLLEHPNPCQLSLNLLKIAIIANSSRIKMFGDPGIDDWDDYKYVKPEKKEVSYYGSTY